LARDEHHTRGESRSVSARVHARHPAGHGARIVRMRRSPWPACRCSPLVW